MTEARGVLLLTDPIRRKDCFSQMQIEGTALVFHENGRFFPQAQAAFQEMRKRYAWICVAAGANVAGVALALAAQLPVDRLAIAMEAPDRKRPRELRRMEVFARRNLPLLICETLLVGGREADARRFARGFGRYADVRRTDAAGLSAEALVSAWQDTDPGLRENGKYV